MLNRRSQAKSENTKWFYLYEFPEKTKLVACGGGWEIYYKDTQRTSWGDENGLFNLTKVTWALTFVKIWIVFKWAYYRMQIITQ